jgi:hypothetical protein
VLFCPNDRCKWPPGEETDSSNQKTFVEELGLDFQAEAQEKINGRSIVDIWDLVSLRFGEPVFKYRRSTEPDRLLAPSVNDGVLPPPQRYVPGRWKFFCKQMLLKPSSAID